MTLDEIAPVPGPKSDRTWPLMIEVVESVRKVKAEASISIKAPVQRVEVTCNADDGAALDHAVIDLRRMLSIEDFDLDDTPGATGLSVDVQLGEATPTT